MKRCVWVVECQSMGHWVAYGFFSTRKEAREFKTLQNDGTNVWRILRYKPER